MNTPPLLPSTDSLLLAALRDQEPVRPDVRPVRDEQLSVACAELVAAKQALATLQSDMQNLLDGSGITAIVVDQQMRVQRFTPNGYRIANLVPSDIGRPLDNVLAHLIGCDQLLVAVQAVLGAPAPEDVHVQVQQPTSRAWFEVCIRPYRQQNGVIHGASIIFSDISALKQTQQAFADGEARYRALVDWSLEAINILRDGKFVYVNPVAIKTYGATRAQDLLGQPSRDRVHPDDLPMALGRMSLVTSSRITAPLVEMRFLKLDGTVIDVQAQAKLIDYEGGPAVHVAWRDITRQKSAEAARLQSDARLEMADQVLHLAFHDELTNIPNRRALTERLHQAMLISKRSACYGAVIFLDLDNFKSLNDTHGHAAGDLLLIEVAQRLQSCVREIDTVARFGGDEFLVMLSQLNAARAASAEQATNLAEKIRIALAQPYQLTCPGEGTLGSSIEYFCTASIGVALFISDETSHEDILKWADTAMYQAKNTGRNRVYFHHPID